MRFTIKQQTSGYWTVWDGLYGRSVVEDESYTIACRLEYSLNQMDEDKPSVADVCDYGECEEIAENYINSF